MPTKFLSNETSLWYFLQYQVSSGMIANKIPYSDYETIDKIRLTAIQILLRDGDRMYSLSSFSELIQEALLEFEENKMMLSNGRFNNNEMAKGGGVGKHDSWEMIVISKELNKDGGKFHKNRFLVSATSIDEAKKITEELWNENFSDSDLSIVSIMSESLYRLRYMDKYAKGGGVANFTISDYKKNEQTNNHSLNALMLVKKYGSQEELDAVQRLVSKGQREGGFSSTDYREVYDLSNKYYPLLLKEGKKITKGM